MKATQSLLALIQLLAVCQILFGAAGLYVLYEDQVSNLGAQFGNQEGHLQRAYPGAKSNLWEHVQRWHKHTIEVTRIWCFVSGVAIFALATGASLRLRGPSNSNTKDPLQ